MDAVGHPANAQIKGKSKRKNMKIKVSLVVENREWRVDIGIMGS